MSPRQHPATRSLVLCALLGLLALCAPRVAAATGQGPTARTARTDPDKAPAAPRAPGTPAGDTGEPDDEDEDPDECTSAPPPRVLAGRDAPAAAVPVRSSTGRRSRVTREPETPPPRVRPAG